MKKIFQISYLFIAITLIILGLRWMIVDEPWLLDKVANEERLGMSFKELFDNNINQSLPDYLRQIYRFFGLWIIIIGFFVLGLSSSSMLENSKIRIILLACVGVMSYSGLLLAIIWIPKSPFVYLGCSMVAIHVLTFYSHIKIS
ncbi:MAG: hypothetical protein CBC76_01175 [Flavobacteriaceae bacterium TMED116]|mgnify:FL=1|nr:MAG: hypothetical protein CBC76_01175 [Flavobacteriaceae bacterium TMED116]|tara:strand:- start:5360 stop:5791 length:432 start_codon:yes stop_codon:yes gene_type:complete